jgi:hypothetical protein
MKNYKDQISTNLILDGEFFFKKNNNIKGSKGKKVTKMKKNDKSLLG